jgi:hypothetical protein
MRTHATITVTVTFKYWKGVEQKFNFHAVELIFNDIHIDINHG